MTLIDPQRLTSAERLFLGHALIICYFTTDNEEGGQEYYFAAFPGERLEEFHTLLSAAQVPLEKVSQIARIVASGEGSPDAEVKEWVERHYGIRVDAPGELAEAI